MIRSLDDLKKEQNAQKKPRKTNDYYAGGDKSGIAIQTPEDVQNIMRRASENTKKSRSPSASQEREPIDPANEIEVKISLYANGFIVDEEDFRPYNTPDAEQFMKELNDGRVPTEIRHRTQGKKVIVSLGNYQKIEYRIPTPPSYVAFSGEGQTLGATKAPKTAAVMIEESKAPEVNPD